MKQFILLLIPSLAIAAPSTFKISLNPEQVTFRVTPSVSRSLSSSMSEIDVVAYTIAAESRGEGYRGMLAVANVIQLRASIRRLSFAGVCKQKSQFEVWHEGEPSCSLNGVRSDPQYSVAYQIAKQMIAGNLQQVIVATHFVTKDRYPYWTKGKSPVAVLGNHKFYDLR